MQLYLRQEAREEMQAKAITHVHVSLRDHTSLLSSYISTASPCFLLFLVINSICHDNYHKHNNFS